MTDEELAVDQEETPEDAQTEEEQSDEEKAMAKLKEAVVVAKEEIGPLRLKLDITIPRDHVDERMGEQFDELKRDAMVPGFRKGHAPMKLVEKRFAGDVGDQLKSQLISSGYLAASENEDIKTLGDPKFWVTVKEERVGEDNVPKTVETEKLVDFDEALDHITLPKEGDFSFACEVELKPEFELPKLDKIPVKKPVIKIEDDDVDNELKRMRMYRGSFVPVEGGKVEADDMLYADFTMSVDGEVIDSETNHDVAARDIQLKGVPLAGFGDAVLGKKVDDEVTVDADVPDDHENIDIRGKKATFKVTVREIKRLELPPIDEEFLSSIGMESEKELRDAVRSNLEQSLGQTVSRAMREQVGDYLIEQTELEIPEGLSQRQTERSISRRGVEMLQQGYPPNEVEKALDGIRSSARDQVVKDLKLYFVLEKIAEDREIEVRDEELNAAMAQIAQRSGKRFDRVRDELSKGDGLTTMYLQIRDEKVLAALLEEAEVTEEEAPKKPAAKKATTKKAVKKAPEKKTAEKKTPKKKTAKKAKKSSS